MISRRRFLKRSGVAGMAITTARAGLAATLVEAVNSSPEEPVSSLAETRVQRSFEIRCDAARAASNRKISIPATNGDEERYPDKRASFAKGLPHNELGEVEPRAYSDWLSILASGDSERFDNFPAIHWPSRSLIIRRQLMLSIWSVSIVMRLVCLRRRLLRALPWRLRWGNSIGKH